VSFLLLIVGVLIAILLALLVWSAGKKNANARDEISRREGIYLACKHLKNLPQLRQALEPSDFEYLKEHLGKRTAQKVQRERRRIALRYLEALHEDFVHLMQTAQLIASLSPEVEATQEWRRFKLSLKFEMKYRFLKAKYGFGSLRFPAMGNLALLVSSLAIDLERIVNEMSAAAMLGREETLADR
jgi:hypothetical protein